MDIFNIQALIARRKLRTIADIDPATTYVQIGVYTPPEQEYRPSGNAYPSFAIALNQLISAGGQGPPGPQGPPGIQGIQGVQGSTGATGPSGIQGPAGNTGATGAPGPQGIQGDPGPIGPAGLEWQGAWSAAGVYSLDDAVGYGGASWFCINPVGPSLTSPDLDPTNWALLAAQGAQGIQGPTGSTGATGAAGPPGIQGPPGATGAPGSQGIQGIQGATGLQGPPGPAGLIQSVTGLNTNNIDPANPVVQISVDGTTITGSGTPASPLVAIGGGGGGITSIPLSNAVYVSPSGNDGTGLRNDLSKPFATIAAANTAALAGDTIVVFPATYEMAAGIVLKNNVNFQFLGTGTLRITLGVLNFLFDDTTSTGAVTTFINAPGWTFEGRGYASFPDWKKRGIIKLTKASNVTLIVDKAIADDTCFVTIGAHNGTNYTIVPTLNITANLIRTKLNDRHGAFDMRFTSSTINAGDIIIDLSDDYDKGVINTEFCPYMNVKARNILNNGSEGGVIRMFNAFSDNRYYCEFDYMYCTKGWPVYMEGSDLAYAQSFFRGNRIESASDCCIVATGASEVTIEGVLIYSTCPVPNKPDGIFHAEGGTLNVKSCSIVRAPGVNQGNDGLASGSTGTLRFIGTSYNSARLCRLNPTATIKEWNGSSFVEAPTIETIPPFLPGSGNEIIQSIVEDTIINYGSFTNCTINNSIIKNSTITFTGNSQSIDSQVWISDVLVSPPPFRPVNYGTTINLTAPTNVLVGAGGAGLTTVFLPISNLAPNNIVIVSDYGADAGSSPIDVTASGAADTIISDMSGPTFTMNTPGQSRTFRLVDNTPGAYIWKIENYV